MKIGIEATPQEVAAERERLGLDRPVPVRYAVWLSDVAQLNLGRSLVNGRAGDGVDRRGVSEHAAPGDDRLRDLVADRAAARLPRGRAPERPGRRSDHRFQLPSGWAIPSFWLGLMLILLFAVTLQWLPPSGIGNPGQPWYLSLQFLILPTVTIALFESFSVFSRFVRSAMLEVLGADFVRTARAKGLRERTVVGAPRAAQRADSGRDRAGHPVRSAARRRGRHRGGVRLSRPGRLVVTSIQNRDYPVVQGALMLVVVIFLLTSMVVDLSYAYLDPRVTLAGTRSMNRCRLGPSAARGRAQVARAHRPARRLVRNPKGASAWQCCSCWCSWRSSRRCWRPYSPNEIHVRDQLAPPSREYLFGTDEVGRDVLSRVIYSARPAIVAGLVTVALAAVVGALTGLVAGYRAGVLDALLMRVWDMLARLPGDLPGDRHRQRARAGLDQRHPGDRDPEHARVLAPGARQHAGGPQSRLRGRRVRDRLLGLADHVSPRLPELPGATRRPDGHRRARGDPDRGDALVSRPGQSAARTIVGQHAERRPGLPVSRAWYALFPGLAITIVVVGMNFFADGLQDALDPARQRNA